MRVEVIQDAPILLPNKEHQNFTKSEQKIPIGARIDGKPINIKGKRRGEDFEYKLFLTDSNKYIHLNKIKPMRTTEVMLGADAKQSPTIVDIPATKKLLTKNIVIGVLASAGVGYYYSAKVKGMEKKKVIVATLIGGTIGFLTAKYLEKRKPIVIKASK